MSEFRSAIDTTPSSLEAAVSVSNQTTDRSILAEKGDPGVFTYEAVHGHPLTADYFEIKTFWDSPTANKQDEIKEVDSWVQTKAQERNLQDKRESYQEIVDGILEQIGRSDNEKPEATFERVKTAIQATKRLEEAKLSPILSVESLTPEEYKKTRA